ncbi:MAG: 23S rRNA (guanosine(2251)-2'-O)-methyltransferase RlmB [Tissierellia bacterium]|jgi:23S rRNA (guanosine2251-2'-O)-methyltransferase|nr:23S rRNA (guanosine(2251)-2'-O)-methyltransferase RlmB [Tissierellia bacterium]
MKENYIYGRNPVIEVLKSGGDIDKIYMLKGADEGSIKKILSMAKEAGVVVTRVDERKLSDMAGHVNHQGVVAMVTDFEYSTIDEILDYAKEKEEEPFVLILDSIEDTHNLGAIIRTAEASGVHGVIIPKRRSAMVNDTVYKTSAGAVEYMKVARVTNIARAIEELQEKGLWIYGADMEGSEVYYDANLTGNIGLVIGGEDKGISPLIGKKCDVLVKIPMVGKVSSLNASVSAAILIYEIIRQRNKKI